MKKSNRQSISKVKGTPAALPKKKGSAGVSARTSPRKTKTVATLSKGGGNATAGGVSFQASLGAIIAAQLLAERALDPRLCLGAARPKGIRFESEAPLDDIVIETDKHGWVLIQAKNSLSASSDLNSEFGKTAQQIVTQWIASSNGTGKWGWDRPLDVARDRFVVAVGPGSSAALTGDLAKALSSIRASHSAPLPIKQRDALHAFEKLLKAAWRKASGHAAPANEIRKILQLVILLRFDVGGPDRNAAIEMLAHVTEKQARAPAAFLALERASQDLMARRQGADAAAFRLSLDQTGIALKAAPSYLDDVQALRKYSAAATAALKDFETIHIDGKRVSIPRKSVHAVAVAAKADALLIIGDPGAGKSAVVNSAAATLQRDKYDVIVLAVDRLQVNSGEELRAALGLEHSLRSVLDNWPGSKPAFLFIDALDATRGGQGEAVFRTLIGDVMALPSKRWRVVASIRSFDLRLGEQFRELFHGSPPDPALADPTFSDARHINIPRWTTEELAALLQQAPSLAKAIDTGGEKLQDLALVPFNTRLLADLISSGMSADAFGQVSSQVELLSLYWRKRVIGLGAGAEVCLRALVTEMVRDRTLQSAKLTGATADAAALNALLLRNVITTVAGDRYVAFRHHILFDYAASRVFIDPLKLGETAELLRRERDLALMLAPALSYALQELWVNGAAGHPEFWSAAVAFAGDVKSDPIARSVASRVACELPQAEADMGGLTRGFGSGPEQEATFKALQHFIGALQVRADDKQPLPIEPWCALAETMSKDIAKLAWPLRNLLTLAVSRVTSDIQRAKVGTAARALLAQSLSDATGNVARLTPSGIEFVAATYISDVAASRTLLSQLLTTERMDRHAHEDMPTLARQARSLISADPEFLITIYGTIYGYKVTDTSSTSIGQSQILPLTSNKKQDYDHAKWQLKEDLPAFLESDPQRGVRAINAALEAYVRVEEKSDAPEQTFVIAGTPATLVDDMSQYWAHDLNDPHAHADNAASILVAFKQQLEALDDDAAKNLVQFIVQHIKLAVLWSRLFVVAARRSAALGPILWPYASDQHFLLSTDTRKYAIDAVAGIYPQLDILPREAFEAGISRVEFSDVENPTRTKLRFLATLFATIGETQLATPAAKSIVEEARGARLSSENTRPVQIFSTWSAPEPYWFLDRKGVDLQAPANRAILQLVEGLPERGKQNAGAAISLAHDVQCVKALATALGVAPTASPLVIEHAENALLGACSSLCWRKDELRASPAAMASLCDIALGYLAHPRPNGGDKPSAGPRSMAVEAALRLSAVDQATADRVVPRIENVVADADAGVRVALADGFSHLWEYRRPDLWKIAEHFARDETNGKVLPAFVNFLCRAVHHDQAKVEELVLALIPRAHLDEDEKGDRIIYAIGSLVGVLWLRYDRPKSRELLTAWLNEPLKHKAELRSAIGTLRNAVVGGYTSEELVDQRLQRKSQSLAAEVVERTATILDGYLAMAPAARIDSDHALAGAAAQLLDHVGDQFYYSTGAFRANDKAEETGLIGSPAKLAFLNDTEAMLRRVGGVATPHTIHNLIELLDFLAPADPERVFDLVAHSLLGGGRKWGYEMESLGVDRFVKVVGVFLADHRDIFKDSGRREQLIGCLDAFVEVGWPSARRLLYRLPELL